MSTILVAEDDGPTRELIQGVLKRAGHAVTTAPDGAAALKKLHQKKFDLLVTDIWMPRMSGIELLAQLRREPNSPRALALTSDDTPETLLRAIRESVYNYARKPVDPERLVEMVSDALAAQPSVPPIEVLCARPNWLELLVPCDHTTAKQIISFIDQLKMDLPREVREQIGLAFRELINNAIEWGGKLDPNQKVRISYLRAKKMVLYRITDPGTGFHFEGLTHAAISNPEDEPYAHDKARAEKGIRPGGFGIMMVRQIADELLYNEAQNDVVFVKYVES